MPKPKLPKGKIKHTEGAEVTSVPHGFMGVVVETHTSYRVSRLTVAATENSPEQRIDVQVGENEEFHDDDRVMDTTVSYLVERNWDGMKCWVTEDVLSGGHLGTHQKVKAADAPIHKITNGDG